MPRMDVAFHDRIKLKHPKAQLPAFFHAIHDQLFTDVPATYPGRHGIAGIANMPAPTDIVGVENIQTQDDSVFLCYTGVALRCKERGTGSYQADRSAYIL